MNNLSGPLPGYIAEAARTWGRNIPRLRSADMVLTDPDLPYLVRGILPQRGVAAIYGPPGSGKTFLAMDLMFNLATACRVWFCMPMKPAKVIYIPLEGRGGIKKRIDAWQRHTGLELGEQLQIWDDHFRLDDHTAIDELTDEANASVGKGAVVVVDTLAQSMAGFDENSSADMGAAIAGAQRLAAQVEGLVILIHHSGKDPTKGMRGHSSLLGAVDASIEVGLKPGGRSWKVRKSKDGEAGQEFDFVLHRVDLGCDADGDPIYSCVVRQTAHVIPSQLRAVQGAHRIAVMSALTAALGASAMPMDIGAAVDLVAPALALPSKRQRTVARTTIESLVQSGHLVRDDTSIRLPP